MRTLRGSVDQVLAHGRELGDDYLRVLLDEPPRPGLADQVRQELPQAVDVSIVRDDDVDAARDDTSAFDADDLRQSPVALFGEYLGEQGIEDPRLDKLFAELLDDATTGKEES
jgi:exonuclease SbcD